MKKKIIYLIIGFIIFCLLLLIFDTKVLVYESKTIRHFIPDVTISTKKIEFHELDCKYFTGRNFVNREPDSSRDTCAFLIKK
jgi:hypothetical protein